MGCDVTRWTPPGGDTLDELSPIAQPARAGKEEDRGDLQSGAAERVSGNACDFERLVPECRKGEADGKHGLPSRHDGRSDRGPADRPRHAAPLAGTLDGLALRRRSMRQRLCLRLSEQPLVVVSDDAAPGGSSSADRVRESVWRGGRHSRSPCRAEETSEPARFRDRRARPPAEDARTGRSQSGRTISGIGPRRRTANPAGRSGGGGESAAGSAIVRSAFRRPTPTMPA